MKMKFFLSTFLFSKSHKGRDGNPHTQLKQYLSKEKINKLVRRVFPSLLTKYNTKDNSWKLVQLHSSTFGHKA